MICERPVVDAFWYSVQPAAVGVAPLATFPTRQTSTQVPTGSAPPPVAVGLLTECDVTEPVDAEVVGVPARATTAPPQARSPRLRSACT
jgi:hypothetical protein